jgi:hypothetical protein
MRALAFLCVALAVPAAALAESGSIDWQRKVVKCTGTGAPNLRDSAENVAVARIGAERAAKLDALRNCMEALKGVAIKSGETVGGALSGDSGLNSKVEGVVRGFKVIGAPRYYSDGGVEMDVEVPLEGALAEVLMPKGEAAPAAAAPAVNKASGLILDARGLKVAPALAPRILGESGQELYGPSCLAAEARTRGGAAYARDVQTAKKQLVSRIGDRPLVVKAIEAQGADLVIGKADAEILKGEQKLLADGRVVIITD